MSDWSVGDLAVCVDHSTAAERANPRVATGGDSIKSGESHRVTRLASDHAGTLGLGFAGPQSAHPTGAYRADAFRKIAPDQHEGEREDWELLLDSMKRKVRV